MLFVKIKIIKKRLERARAFSQSPWGLSGRVHDFRLGVWHCTAGAIECNELGDELQTILKGKVRLIEADGSSEVYEAGDSFFTRQGDRVTWDVIEDVTKVFYATREGGF